MCNNKKEKLFKYANVKVGAKPRGYGSKSILCI